MTTDRSCPAGVVLRGRLGEQLEGVGLAGRTDRDERPGRIHAAAGATPETATRGRSRRSQRAKQANERGRCMRKFLRRSCWGQPILRFEHRLQPPEPRSPGDPRDVDSLPDPGSFSVVALIVDFVSDFGVIVTTTMTFDADALKPGGFAARVCAGASTGR